MASIPQATAIVNFIQMCKSSLKGTRQLSICADIIDGVGKLVIFTYDYLTESPYGLEDMPHSGKNQTVASILRLRDCLVNLGRLDADTSFDDMIDLFANADEMKLTTLVAGIQIRVGIETHPISGDVRYVNPRYLAIPEEASIGSYDPDVCSKDDLKAIKKMA